MGVRFNVSRLRYRVMVLAAMVAPLPILVAADPTVVRADTPTPSPTATAQQTTGSPTETASSAPTQTASSSPTQTASSSPTDATPSTPSDNSSSTPADKSPFAEVDAGLVGGHSVSALSGTGIETAIPSVSGATSLNLAVRIVRNRVLRAAASQGGEVNIGWQAIATSPDALGILIETSRVPQGGTADKVPVTLWYSQRTGTVGTGAVLIEPSQWDDFARLVVDEVGRHGGDSGLAKTALATSGQPQGSGPAIGFNEDGDVVVGFASGVVGTTEPLVFSIGGDGDASYLSSFGRLARDATRHPTAYVNGAQSASAASFATAASESRPDADVVGDCAARKCVALTFDDGPGTRTREAAQGLAKAGLGGTFFMLGDSIQNDPDAVKAVALLGQEVSSHTWRHVDLTKSATRTAQYNVGHNASAIRGLTGDWPVMMRPPYGEHDARINGIVGGQGEVVVQWSVDTRDWAHKSVARTVSTASQAKSGDIVLMHDIHDSTVTAIPQIVANLTKAGYQIVPVSELSSPNDWQVGKAYCAAPWRNATCW